jgi:serine phosphatase RsbU (regulator of sigma subunit)
MAFTDGLLLDPAPVVLPGVGAAVAMIVMLFVEGRRLQRELRAAEGIQKGMLVPRARLAEIAKGVDIDAVLEPARTVGGDLYDAFALPGGRVCFVVGDATGKGLSAALFMALAKAITRSLLTHPTLDLAEAIDRTNTDLSADNAENMQLSLLVGVLHPDGRLEMISAGHENPFVVGTDGQVRTLKLDGGPPLCAMEGFPYPLELFRLEPGEILLAFTDGVTEAQDPDQDLYGAVRAAAAVGACAGPGPLKGMVDGIVSAVRAFEAGAEPSDDLTILAIRRAA